MCDALKILNTPVIIKKERPLHPLQSIQKVGETTSKLEGTPDLRKARESVESSDDSYHSLDSMEISLNNEGSVDHQVKETMENDVEVEKICTDVDSSFRVPFVATVPQPCSSLSFSYDMATSQVEIMF